MVDATADIGEGADIGPQCVVGAGAGIGAGTVLSSRVTVADECEIGERCLLHPGVVIGADGFGFARMEPVGSKLSNWVECESGDDVEIGANTCIV